MMRPLIFTILIALPALAQEDGGVALDSGAAEVDAGTPVQTLLVMNLEANEEARALAPAASQDLAFRMQTPALRVLTQVDVQAAIGRERQAELLGCSDGSCLIELGQALGSRFIVSGRLDKLGANVIVVASVFDAQSNTVTARAREEFDKPDLLPATTRKIADTLLAAMGVQKPQPVAPVANVEQKPPAPAMSNSGLNLSLRLGTQFFTSLVRLAPQVDLEFAWRFNLQWSAFFQISSGFVFVPELTATITPGLLGVRYNFRSDSMFQPVLGGGLGLYGTIRSAFQVRPSVVVFGGAQFFPLPRLGIALEAQVDVLGAAFDLFQGMDVNRTGVNLGLSLGVLYRF
ncbi:MAG: hypothetical protein JNM17_00455 [Archangium sp.]|nr:hypothetical protein [Archangium sp.]